MTHVRVHSLNPMLGAWNSRAFRSEMTGRTDF